MSVSHPSWWGSSTRNFTRNRPKGRTKRKAFHRQCKSCGLKPSGKVRPFQGFPQFPFDEQGRLALLQPFVDHRKLARNLAPSVPVTLPPTTCPARGRPARGRPDKRPGVTINGMSIIHVVGLSADRHLETASGQKPVGERKVPLEHPQQLVGLLVMLLDRCRLQLNRDRQKHGGQAAISAGTE